jgi:secreted trypsin-like serine protease
MGDSGGPFVCRDKSNRWVLHGAVSWGSRTCSAGQNEFTVFARVAEFVNWIKQHVGNIQPPPGTPSPPTPSPPSPSSGKNIYNNNVILMGIIHRVWFPIHPIQRLIMHEIPKE